MSGCVRKGGRSISSSEGPLSQLEEVIDYLETQRAVLGDAAVDASIATLREKLAALEPEDPPEQRKLVTVLFCDLVDFTAMAERMDPEEVREILNRWFQPWRDAIEGYGGRLEKYIGDAVMAVFGIPIASETDPEDAIRAALRARASLVSVNEALERECGLRLAMRVGISTGMVLVAQSGRTGDFTATGDTVNLASRLEGRAPKNGILISHDTYRHVRGLFDVRRLEPMEVKGKREPVQTYLVRQAKARAFRRGVRGVEGIETRMIGRRAELERLQDTLRVVVDEGERRVVTIIGEAGVGKSRLLYEFEDWADLLHEQVFLYKGRAARETQGVPYALIRDLFAFRIQIQAGDPASVVRRQLQAGIEDVLSGTPGEGSGDSAKPRDSAEIKAHFIGQLLGFDFSDSPHLRHVGDDAQQLRDRATLYIAEYFRAMTARFPIAILLEDVHWADSSSLEVIDRLALAIPDRPVLIIMLARPSLLERRPVWGEGQPFHTRLRLDPLTRRESHELVREILRKADRVPQALRNLVVEKAGGNPFYVEELVKMLIEDGVIVLDEERWRVEPALLTSVPVPPTLTGVLQARLDRLPLEERSVMQQASVVGRRFWDRVVVRIGESTQAAVDAAQTLQALSNLRRREMVFLRQTSSFAGSEEYIFKHALLREVSYETVLKRVRRAYHAIVAEWLQEQSGERSGEYTGLIADHLEAAGQAGRAAAYLREAGEQAAARFANAEAVAYLSRALKLTAAGDQAAQYSLLLRRESVYDLLAERGPEMEDLGALQELAEALDDDEKRAEVALRQANYSEATGDFRRCLSAARLAIVLSQDAQTRAQAYLALGQALIRLGEYEEARPQLEQALVEVGDVGSEPGARLLEAASLRALGLVCYNLSDYDRARVYMERALGIRRETGDRRGEGQGLNSLGVVLRNLGDLAAARTCFEQSLQIRREIGDRQGEGAALTNLGLFHLDQGDAAAALPCYEEALRIQRQAGDRHGEAITLANLGSVCFGQGDYGGARDRWQQALALYRQVGDQRGEGIVVNNLGLLSRNLGDYARAKAFFEEALPIRRQIGDQRGISLTLANLGLLAHLQGDDVAAREYSHQALLVAREIHHPSSEGTALTRLGHALAGSGDLAGAQHALDEALAIRRKLGEHNVAMECLAGLAVVSLEEGDLKAASAHVDEILAHLETGTLEGTDDPFRIYLTCCRVLRASSDPRATELLLTSSRLLHQQAAKIGDEAMRHSFLMNVECHRQLLAEGEELDGLLH